MESRAGKVLDLVKQLEQSDNLSPKDHRPRGGYFGGGGDTGSLATRGSSVGSDGIDGEVRGEGVEEEGGRKRSSLKAFGASAMLSAPPALNLCSSRCWSAWCTAVVI